jgi:hypothetical protein
MKLLFLMLAAMALPSASAALTQSNVVGAWSIEQTRDPINDRVEVHATVHGDNADLVFMCGDGRPVLVYQPRAFLGASGGRYTQYDLRDMVWRFDSGPPQSNSWKYLNEYAVPYNTKDTAAFVSKIIGSTRLVMRALRYDGATIDSTFDLTGAPQALRQTFEACGIHS